MPQAYMSGCAAESTQCPDPRAMETRREWWYPAAAHKPRPGHTPISLVTLRIHENVCPTLRTQGDMGPASPTITQATNAATVPTSHANMFHAQSWIITA